MPIVQLLHTDRGTLSLVQEADRRFLRRTFAAGMADRSFRHKLDELTARINRYRPPAVLPIIGHGQAGSYYYIDYEQNGWVQTLAEYFAQSTWLERLQLVHSVLGYRGPWYETVEAAFALHGSCLVVVETNHHHIEARLAACPPLQNISAYHLRPVDPFLLCAVAPEWIRGVSLSAAPEERYAAGTLVLQALGYKPRRDHDPEKCIELQARGQLLDRDKSPLKDDPALWQISLAQTRLILLEKAALDATHFVTVARQESVEKLHALCRDVLDLLNPELFARLLSDSGRTYEALAYLEWYFAIEKSYHDSARRLAITYCADLGLSAKELQHLDMVLKQSPRDIELAQRRWELRSAAYTNHDPTQDIQHDSKGDWLLQEGKRLHPHAADDPRLQPDVEKSKGYWRTIAMIHGRRGQLFERAQALYQLSLLDFRDVGSLLLYGLTLQELANQKDIGTDYKATLLRQLEQLVRTVEFRLKALNEAGILEKDLAQQWTESLHYLLGS